MRKALLAVAGAVVIIAGGAYYGLVLYPQQRFRSELDAAIARLPHEVAVTYQSAEYSVLAGQATVRGIAVKHPEPDPVELSIDEVMVVKPSLDLATGWAAAAASASRQPDTGLPVAESTTVKGVSFSTPKMHGSMSAITVVHPRVYPWALLHAGVPSWSEIRPMLMQPPAQPQLAEMLPFLRFEAAAALSFAYDRYEASDIKMSLTMPPSPQLPETTVDYVFASMRGEGYERGKAAAAGGSGITGTVAAFGGFAIERIAMEGFDVRRPLEQVLEGAPLGPALLDGLSIGKIEYAGMTMTPNGKTPIALGTFSFGRLAFAQGMPISAQISYTGLHLDRTQVPLPPEADAYRQLLGLDAVTFGVALAYDWDLGKQHMSLHDVRVKIDELGTLDFAIDADNVAPGLAAAQQAKLAHARLSYTDASLAERALRAGATTMGAEPAALRAQLIQSVEQQAAALGGSPQIAEAAKAIVAFLGAPTSLTIELSPAKPVDLAALQGAAAIPPPELAALLGLKVSANQ